MRLILSILGGIRRGIMWMYGRRQTIHPATVIVSISMCLLWIFTITGWGADIGSFLGTHFGPVVTAMIGVAIWLSLMGGVGYVIWFTRNLDQSDGETELGLANRSLLIYLFESLTAGTKEGSVRWDESRGWFKASSLMLDVSKSPMMLKERDGRVLFDESIFPRQHGMRELGKDLVAAMNEVNKGVCGMEPIDVGPMVEW
jgi:hypothetical protein